MAYRILLLALVLMANLTTAQWFWQNPLPQGNLLYNVDFISPNIGWAVGDEGTIIHTTDGGITWTLQTSGTTNYLLDVFFIDENNGTVVGGGGTILRTTNGGTNWISQTSGASDNLTGVFFTDLNNGTIVGRWGTIIKTTNGGLTWTSQASGTTQWLWSISYSDEYTGTISGTSGTILHTTNGGINWTQQTSGTSNHLYENCFTDVNNGTIVGNYGTILRTTNGGTTWIEQTSGISSHLRSVSFTDFYNGTAVGESGTIIRTTNGGTNWTLQSSSQGYTLFGVSYSNSNNGTAVGTGGLILKTTNSGTTWFSQRFGTTEWLCDVSFTDANNGTVVGQNGIILHTTNGGINWSFQSSGTNSPLSGVHFTDANIGTVVGYSYPIVVGIILRTTNAGTNWIQQTCGVTDYLIDVFFTDANNGTIVGNNGIVLKTTNGGSNWTQQTSGTTNVLRSVFYTNANIGTIVGNNGIILKTINGGTTWIQQASGTTKDLYSVFFNNSNVGTAVGDSGTIIRTTNGGTTWYPQISGTIRTLNDISFTSIDHGTVVGIYGVILETTNGGTNWTLQSDPAGIYCYLNGLSFSDENHGWTVGGNGTILAYNGFSYPSLEITSPIGGENWQVGGTYEITWNSEGVSNVKIDYSTDNGINWLPITSSTQSDGSYSWAIPNTPSTQCKVKVTDVINPSVSNESDNPFIIVYHIPVVIIPGIMGSPLFNDLDDNNHLIRNPSDFANDEYIWADTKQAAFDLYDVFLESLSLNDDGNTSSYNIKVAPLKNDIFTAIGDIMHYKPFDTYYGLIFSLVMSAANYNLNDFDYNHTEGEDLYVFTYDWRKSCAYNANLLNELIDSIFVWNSVTKVNLVCHSMGGLIAKKYLSLSQFNNSKINKLIFIATPHLGAPKILYVMLRGKLGLRWVEDFGLYDARIRQISRNMPSTYELMPSLNYSNIFIDTGPRNNTYLYNYFFDTPQFGYTNYYQMLQFYNSVVLPDNFTYNSNLNNSAHNFREGMADIDLSGIEVYNIVGYDKPTIGRVTVKEGWWSLGDIDPDKTEGLMNLSGDGTVPLRSAEIVNLNKRIADYYVKDVEHSELPSSEPVKELISNLLKEPAILTYTNPAITEIPPVDYAVPDLKQVTVSSPVELHAYDLLGNHTGPISDSTWEESIPGSEYFPGDLRIPHSTKTILIPEETDFRVEILSQDTTASFDYILNEIVDGVSVREFSFDSVVIFDNTIAHMDVYDTTNTFGLDMDYDGNGVIDSTILPTVTNFCKLGSVEQGWNLISIPFLSDVKLKTNLFPEAVSNAFWFNGGYVVRDTLEVRKGYWLKFNNAYSHVHCGQMAMDTIHVKAGWNLIGCFNKDVPIVNIDTDPPGILTSNFYGYAGSYNIADTLKIGKGYWIKSTQNGVVNFNQSLNKTFENKLAIDQSWANITISDAESKVMKLYFADVENPEYYQLPPLPPSGAFDVRFESGTMIEDLGKGDKLIHISGAIYPIRIKVIGTNISVKDVINGSTLNQSIKDGEEIVVYDNRIDKILISGDNNVNIPIAYNLEQNYPNPFNPSTTIKFAIAKEGQVNLSIFNVLGEKIKDLKNEIMKPGYYEVEFNASSLASGIYFYRIKTGEYIDTKKMVLLR